MARRTYRENAKRMLLASFVARLAGKVGNRVRYQNPPNSEQNLQFALGHHEAEKQENFNDSSYTRFENSVKLILRSHG